MQGRGGERRGPAALLACHLVSGAGAGAGAGAGPGLCGRGPALRPPASLRSAAARTQMGFAGLFQLSRALSHAQPPTQKGTTESYAGFCLRACYASSANSYSVLNVMCVLDLAGVHRAEDL